MLTEVAKELGTTDEVIENAHMFASICTPGSDVKEAINKEAPDEVIEAFRAYVKMVLSGAENPEFRRQWLEFYEEEHGSRN